MELNPICTGIAIVVVAFVIIGGGLYIALQYGLGEEFYKG